MSAAAIVVEAFAVAVRAISLAMDVLNQKPDLDLGETREAIQAAAADLKGYTKMWKMLGDL